MTQIRMEHEGATFIFSRAWDGEGRWVCVAGRPSGTIGYVVHNSYVHLQLNSLLTKVAVSKGLGDHKAFSRYLVKEKPKSVRTTSPKKRKRKSGLRGIGLKIASLFENFDTEEKHEITEYEEIETGVSR
ncbi:MAG: hypothetical protein ACXABY_05000 [Candidatus Thorarchaeota archaeon]|jgi:hypothetical protein